MVHPGIYLVSLEAQKEGERLKMKSPGQQNQEGGFGLFLPQVRLAGITHSLGAWPCEPRSNSFGLTKNLSGRDSEPGLGLTRCIFSLR